MGLNEEVADAKADEILQKLEEDFDSDEIQDIAQSLQKKAAIARSL